MNTEERAHLEAGLSTTLTKQMEEFRRERKAWAHQKAEEEAAEREAKAKADKDKYDRLLELQQEAEEQRIRSSKNLNRILAALVTILTAAGGSGAYIAAQPEPAKVEPKEVKATVEANSRAQVQRIEAVEGKVEQLGTAAVESQVQQSAGVEYIVEKIDKAHPRSAEAVDEPEAVEEARIRAEAIQKKKRKAKVLGTKYDPFADLPGP